MFVCVIVAYSSLVASSTGLRVLVPALFTRQSSDPPQTRSTSLLGDRCYQQQRCCSLARSSPALIVESFLGLGIWDAHLTSASRPSVSLRSALVPMARPTPNSLFRSSTTWVSRRIFEYQPQWWRVAEPAFPTSSADLDHFSVVA